MPQELTWYAYGPRSYYPHMKPADIAIWERALAAHPDYFKEVAYDVAVGSGADFDTTVNPSTGSNMNALYRRKIDVVGRGGGVETIVELKPRAGTSAIGQVKGYLHLYRKEYLPASSSKALIITDAMDADAREIAEAEGVGVLIV